jgi:hypothetical protein
MADDIGLVLRLIGILAVFFVVYILYVKFRRKVWWDDER